MPVTVYVHFLLYCCSVVAVHFEQSEYFGREVAGSESKLDYAVVVEGQFEVNFTVVVETEDATATGNQVIELLCTVRTICVIVHTRPERTSVCMCVPAPAWMLVHVSPFLSRIFSSPLSPHSLPLPLSPFLSPPPSLPSPPPGLSSGGLDYVIEATELLFLSNIAHSVATTTIYDDKILEGTETYNLTLRVSQSPTTVLVSEPSEALIHIEDNDGMLLHIHGLIRACMCVHTSGHLIWWKWNCKNVCFCKYVLTFVFYSYLSYTPVCVCTVYFHALYVLKWFFLLPPHRGDGGL